MSEQWAEFYVDQNQPGIVRGGPFDSMGGMLVGVHAKEVCHRLNGFPLLEARLEAVNTIVTRLETLPQETLYSRGIAYEFRSAIGEGNDNTTR